MNNVQQHAGTPVGAVRKYPYWLRVLVALDVFVATCLGWSQADLTISACCGLALKTAKGGGRIWLGLLLNDIWPGHCERAMRDDAARAVMALQRIGGGRVVQMPAPRPSGPHGQAGTGGTTLPPELQRQETLRIRCKCGWTGTVGALKTDPATGIKQCPTCANKFFPVKMPDAPAP